MAGPYLRVREELGPAIKAQWGATVSSPWSPLVPGRALMAGWKTSPLAGVYGPVWAGPCAVFEPPYLRATEEVGPRDEIWLGTECVLP